MSYKLFFTLLFITARAPFLHVNEPAAVHAVLFYSPACGHCHIVIQETLPALINQYGEQLQIIGVDVTQPQGQALFESAIRMFELESAGVPFLVVGNEYLVGSADIPDKFPTLIEQYLAQGGVEWPDIPGLRDALQTAATAQAPAPTPEAPTAITGEGEPAVSESTDQPSESFSLPEASEISVWQRVMLDPLGNGLAIAVLLGMIVIVLYAAQTFRQNTKVSLPDGTQILIPVLCVLGLGVAGYLAYVETTQTTAVCGPVGDCNTVQQSDYASLFGILPIGVLGLIGYLAIIVAWLVARSASTRLSDLATLALFAMTVLGTLFSIYLTFLEPFVIGATCAWCLTSAIIMSLIFLLALPGGRNSLLKLRMHPFTTRNT